MQLVTFSVGNGAYLGAISGERVIDLQAADATLTSSTRTSMPADMLSLIVQGAPALTVVEKILLAEQTGQLPEQTAAGQPTVFPLSAVRLLPPITHPGKIIAIGLNYSDHAAETQMAVPASPVFFAKFSTCLVGHNEPVIHPGADLTSSLDYEVELAVVIGKKGKHIAEADALNYVYGYSIMNDVSARDLQFVDGQWMKGKALDTFAPFGPAIVPAGEIPNPHNLNLRLELNGQVMQDSNTRHMIFSIQRLISYLSRLMTLEPGDVISTGTPPGVGNSRKPPVFLQPGDTMTAEIEAIGKLTNPVVAG